MDSPCAVCTSLLMKAMLGAADPCINAMFNFQSPCGAVGDPWTQCTKPPLDFLCNTVCGAKCKNDKSIMTFMFQSTTTTSTTTASSAAPACEPSQMPHDAMGAAFTFMCVKGPDAATASTSKGFYCQSKIMELQKGGAFQVASPSDEYPDPCSIDCSTKTSQAIKALGCCTGSMIDMMSQVAVTDPRQAKEVKIVKAVAWKCG